MFGAAPHAADNRDYQGRLAASLIGAMGIERALETCLSNGWDGVLEQVPGHRPVDAQQRGAVSDHEAGRALIPDLAKSPNAVK